MTRDDLSVITEFIAEIQTRDDLNVIERAVVAKRMEIGERENEERLKDPKVQAELAALKAAADREEQEYLDALEAEEEQYQRRIVEKERRLAEAPVVGTITLTRIRPAYLVGKTLPVIGILDQSYKCNVPDEPQYKTWRGRKGIRVPKGAATFTTAGVAA